MLQFGSKHVGIEDVHIFKHCHEMTGLLLWIGTYCISCVVQQTSRVNDLSSLVRYDDSCLAAIRYVQSIIRDHAQIYAPTASCSSMKQCLQSMNEEQFPIQMTQDNKHNKWREILDFQPKVLRRKFIASGEDDGN